MATDSETRSPHSQTLSRGIRVLELLSEAGEPLTIAQVADGLGVHRSIAYRILRTLEDHGLVERDDAGRLVLGIRLAVLARSVSRDLQTVALPELTAIANEFGATTFITAFDHREVVTLVSVEPQRSHASVAQRPGSHHSVRTGAPGIAVQMQMTPAQLADLAADDLALPAETLRACAVDGYATSSDEVIPGLSSIAVPLRVPGGQLMSLAVVYLHASQDVDALAARLRAGAHDIASALG